MEDTGSVLIVLFAVALAVAGAVAIERFKKQRLNAVPLEIRVTLAEEQAHGLRNEMMVCPHCQARGQVRTKPVRRKKGVSGAKATAAVLTAGVSILATGLSRKEDFTEAWCGNCKNTWVF